MTDASEPPHSGDPPPGGADDPTFGPGALPGDAAWSIGTILKERYRIDKVIGRGGMGEVWLAHDTVLDRRVALKRALASRTSDAQRRNLILKEARGISALNELKIATANATTAMTNSSV